MDDPNYRVDGLPPAILGKITALISASRDASFAGAMDPKQASVVREYEEICRYNLEQTIKTHLKKKETAE